MTWQCACGSPARGHWRVRRLVGILNDQITPGGVTRFPDVAELLQWLVMVGLHKKLRNELGRTTSPVGAEIAPAFRVLFEAKLADRSARLNF